MPTGFFALGNLRSDTAVPMAKPPWETPPPNGGPPKGATKELFRDWCSRATTNHVFYNAVEGVVPTKRVGAGNEALRTWGFVADYDSDMLVRMPDAEVADTRTAALRKGGIRPCRMSRTFGGKIRLVWEFEKPMPADHTELYAAAMKAFVKESGAERMLPGYDHSCEAVNQYFELGHSWSDAGGKPVPGEKLSALLFRAASKVSFKAESDVSIPIEVVGEEVKSRWPARVTGEFRVGTRLPLFWIDDGVERIGSLVGDKGMVCFSDRAGKSFVPWSEILGKDFVKGYEEKKIASVADNTWFDGKTYWTRSSDRWMARNKDDMLLVLQKAGFSTSPGKGQTISPAGDALLSIQQTRLVDGAAPFLHNPAEIIRFNGETFLNTSRRKAMQRAGGDGDPSKWPFLHRFLHRFFRAHEPDGEEALWHFLAWHRRFWRSCRDGSPLSGHILVFAGGPDTGKSLLGSFIVPATVGGQTDASTYLMGYASFNKQLVEVPVWTVDDASSAANQSDHRRFSEAIKRHTASPFVNYHPKYRDAVTMPWRGRIIITCNTDSSSLDILPALEISVLDKIMLIRVTDEQETFPPSPVLEPMLMSELPHYLDWLDTTDDIPERVLDPGRNRYGVKPYHHPELKRESNERSPSMGVAEAIDAWAEDMALVNPDMEEWVGNSTKLHGEMMNTDSVKHAMRDMNPIRLGKSVRTLLAAGSCKRLLGKRLIDGYNVYRIAIRKS